MGGGAFGVEGDVCRHDGSHATDDALHFQGGFDVLDEAGHTCWYGRPSYLRSRGAVMRVRWGCLRYVWCSAVCAALDAFATVGAAPPPRSPQPVPPSPVLRIDAIHGLHQFRAGLLFCEQVEPSLAGASRVNVHQHDAALGEVLTGTIDALQALDGGADEYVGGRDDDLGQLWDIHAAGLPAGPLSYAAARVMDKSARLSVFSGVPQAQHVDGRFLNLVAHLVVPNEQPPDLTWLELEELLTNPRIGEQDGRGLSQRLHRPRGGLLIRRGQKFVQAYQVGKRLAGPLQLH